MWTVQRYRQRRAANRPSGRTRTRLRSVVGVLASVVLIGTLTQACSNSPSSNSNSGSSSDPGKTAFRIGTVAWASSISNNPYSPNPLPYYNSVQLSLGAVSDWDRPGDNPYYPELASSWTVAKHSVSFDLRPTAKWSNGQPLTTKDVVTSLLAAGADYNSMWAAITSVSTPSAHKVVVNLQSWAVPQTALLHLLQVVIVPDSEYGPLIPAGLSQTLVTYWKTYNILHPTSSSIDNSANSPEGKVLASASSKLVKFSPKDLLGTGPYTLKSANVSGVLYQKWDGWWDAAKITAPYIQVYPMSDSTQYGALISGSIEFENDTQFADPQVTNMNKSGNSHYVFIPSPVQQESLVFNFAHYPFNLLAVRQALAYVIDRQDLVKRDMGGDLVQDPAEETPDGINYSLAKQYLTPAQFAKLNPYSHDTAKAESLLTGAGFTKKDGSWYTPKGDLFSFTISEPAQSAQFDEDGLIIAGYLKDFGVKVDVQNVDQATYATKMLAGDFAVSEDYMDWGQGSPMADFAAGFGQAAPPSYNYPISYSGSGPCKCAIGIGPTADVPGLGTVNIASELNREVNQEPPATWSKYVWAWAQWVNQNLPILPMYNNAFHEAYASARYTNYPPDSAKWLWTGLSGASQPVMWMQEGYLKLK